VATLSRKHCHGLKFWLMKLSWSISGTESFLSFHYGGKVGQCQQ